MGIKGNLKGIAAIFLQKDKSSWYQPAVFFQCATSTCWDLFLSTLLAIESQLTHKNGANWAQESQASRDQAFHFYKSSSKPRAASQKWWTWKLLEEVNKCNTPG